MDGAIREMMLYKSHYFPAAILTGTCYRYKQLSIAAISGFSSSLREAWQHSSPLSPHYPVSQLPHPA